MDPIFWFLGYFVVGMLIGITIAVVAVVQTWQTGEDITLHDLGMVVLILVIMTLFWPIIGCMILYEWIVNNWKLTRNTVILRGSRSAKTFRALRDGNNT